MQDAFKPGQRWRIAKYLLAEARAVDSAIFATRAGESGLDLPYCAARGRQQAVYSLIGVENRYSHAPQHHRRSTLAHANGTGQADDDHALEPSVATMAARSSGLT
jgi:hypothetical protein